MPADTSTVSLGLLLPGTGNDDNTWGDLFNAQVTQYLEDTLVGQTILGTTSATLTQAQCRPRHLVVTGTLTADVTFTVPNVANNWLITNATSGSFGVLFKTASGAAICVPQGTTQEVFCLGSGTVLRVERHLVGEIFYYGGVSPPAGSLECDGSAISRTGLGLDLFTAVGTTWGGSGGTFNLPDAKTAGKFLRSRSGSVAFGTSQSDQNKAHTHSGSTGTWTQSTGTTDDPGTHTHTTTVGNDSPDHTHTYTAPAPSGILGTVSSNSAGGAAGNIWYGGSLATGTATGGASANHTHTVTVNGGGAHTHAVTVTGTVAVTVASDGGTEARPTNLSAIMCIRL